MIDKSKLKHYTIKGRDTLKCRGMLFTEWCELNDFSYMIDAVESGDIDYFEVIINSASLLHIKCYCSRGKTWTVTRLVKFIVKHILSQYNVDIDEYLSHIDCEKDFRIIEKF